MKEGLVAVGVGLFFALGALRIRAAPEGETWAGALPLAAACALMLIGALMVWSAVAGRAVAARDSADRADPADQADLADRGTLLRVGALAILAVLYQQAIGAFGYDLPTAAAAPAALWLFGVRGVARLGLAAVACPAVLHLLFFDGLGVFPPFGTLINPPDWFRS